jgi:uncharacterized flavoprotein (TIGR03862 family)
MPASSTTIWIFVVMMRNSMARRSFVKQDMKKTAAIIGAGPAGLSAAEVLAEAGIDVTLYERMASPARKFLMAGRGGLNLTHSEEFSRVLTRYGAAAERLKPFLDAFGPQEVRDWCAGLGQETFVGSSGRVFPGAMKASPLLRAWLRRLDSLGVKIRLRHDFRGFEGRAALFETPEGPLRVEADVMVLALGGASWPRLGADGSWVAPLAKAGLPSAPLRPANCGLLIGWSEFFAEKFGGQPLKNIALRCEAPQGEEKLSRVVRGEAMVTRRGLEGGAVYALSGDLRDSVARDGEAGISIDLRPDVPKETLAHKLAWPRGKQSQSNFIRKAAGLSPLAIALMRESGPLPETPEGLAERIKALPLRVTGVAGLERAISTAGGLIWDALDENLMAKNFPGLFVAGEMLDWEAPTGGYLLTACFATGRAAGRAAAAFATRSES